jgi:hypothetical protein
MSTTAFSGPIALNVKVSVKPERREDFLKIIQYDAEQTLLTEPGALQFTVGEDVRVRPISFTFMNSTEPFRTSTFIRVRLTFSSGLSFRRPIPSQNP